MSTAPIPTGKIRGSLSDVTQKLQNFVGAVKVTTSSGKGGILVNMGRPVASYLAVGGVLHRGKESLDLLEKEELAEYEILRYDEEQFREAVIICENRGLLLEGEKGAAPGAPPRARETKPREEENVLSAMMKRFAIPKIGERRETAQPVPEAGAGVPSPPPVAPVRKEEPLPEPQTPAPAAKKVPAPGREIPSSPPPETELSAIIKRLRDSGRIEKGPAPAPVPEEPARSTGPAPAGEESRPSPLEEILPEAPARASGSTPTPEAPASEERVRVDLGKMMKRIKRLDITSIRKELQEGAEEPGASGAAAGEPSGGPAEPAAPSPGPARASPPAAEARGRSDIDELKAFIQRLEVLDEPEESPPPVKGVLSKLGVKPEPAEIPAPPAEPGAPEPAREKESPKEEVSPAPEGAGKGEAPAPERESRPAEPDRKARIASLLRRSGLVKPPAEEQPRAPPPEAPAMPVVTEEKGEPVPVPAPAGEAEIRAPKPLRKKVEITRVPKRLEKPPREPPLIDERMIQRILKQPGVIAVSTFFEGFAVQSAGRADFEQVAANAEDLFRAGTKIAREIDIGPLNQIILETAKGKLIIAPYGDLNVCIFTEPDANLGLIRVAIKGLQMEKG